MPQRSSSVAIIPGCVHAPNEPIAGLSRQQRLEGEIARRSLTIVASANDADRRIHDCRVLVGDEELHLCKVGVSEVERRLLDSLRKSADGIVARYINRSISLAITRRLMNTRVHPNHVTVFTLLLGLASGVVVALGGYWAAVAGAALLQAQSILDGVDGELARLRFQGSKRGQWLDTISDDLANLSFMLGMAYVAPWPWLGWLGALAAVLFVITEGILYYALVTVYHSGDLLDFEWDAHSTGGRSSALSYLVKRDFFCLLWLGLAVAGLLPIALLMAVAGSIAVFVALMRQLARRGLVLADSIGE